MEFNTEYTFKDPKNKDLILLKYDKITCRVFSKKHRSGFYLSSDKKPRSNTYKLLPQKWKDRLSTYYGYNYRAVRVQEVLGEYEVARYKLNIPKSFLTPTI